MTARQVSETITGPPRPEAPLVLDFSPPKPLGLWDQTVLWGSLGVSLTGPVTALYVLAPLQDGTRMSLFAALVATVVGAVVGSALLGLAAVPGAALGAPAMVTLRGLFGRYGSLAPTVLNIAQNVGWGTIEVIVISSAATALTAERFRVMWVLAAGVAATFMAVRPLGSVRALRKVIIWFVLAASVYLFVELLREPLPPLMQGGWKGFGLAFDTMIAVCVSYTPLISDYSRHSRNRRDAFAGAWIGYAISATAYIALGLLAYSTTVGLNDPDGTKVIGALLSVPAGALALLILAVDEIDEAFANVYSTTMSVHNIAPHIDRRKIAIAVGGLATVLALLVGLDAYQAFLYLIGSVFVPLAAVTIVDWFLVSKGTWDMSETSPVRWSMVMAWFLGFVGYQLVNPGYLAYWSPAWTSLRDAIGVTPPTWMAASWSSFVVAALATYVLGMTARSRNRNQRAGSLSVGA
jgi:putative hydroxymethylpyrimidine transporter CytX